MFFEIEDPSYEKLPFFLTRAGFQKYQPPLEKPQGHAFHQFLVVLKGTGTFTIRNETYTLGKNSICFSRMGVPIRYEAISSEFSTAWITFRGSGSEFLLDYFGIGDCLVASLSDRWVNTIVNYEYVIKNKTVLARSTDSYALVTNLLEYLTLPSSAWQRTIKKIDEYLEKNFSQSITLEDISELTKIDRYTLCKQYRALTNTTIMTKLKSIRMAYAKVMLRNGVSVKETATNCGFDSPSYFIKNFREETGMTPHEYSFYDDE